jgi:hypothetical protein
MLADRYILPRSGPLPLAKISQRDVRTWVAELSTKGLAPATVHKCYQLLSKILAAAVEAGMLPRSPCRQIPLPKIERTEMRLSHRDRGATAGRSHRPPLPGAGAP